MARRSLTKLLTDSLSYLERSGFDGDDAPTFSAGVPVPCRIEHRTRVIERQDGTKIESRITIITEVELDEDQLIVLAPDSVVAENGRVILGRKQASRPSTRGRSATVFETYV